MSRGFIVSHQRVALNLDFNGVAHGYTDLTLTPTIPDLKTIYLNSRGCHIQSVTTTSIAPPSSTFPSTSASTLSSSSPPINLSFSLLQSRPSLPLPSNNPTAQTPTSASAHLPGTSSNLGASGSGGGGGAGGGGTGAHVSGSGSIQSNVHLFPSLKRSVFATTYESEEGELRIVLPPNAIRRANHQSQSPERGESSGATPAPGGGGGGGEYAPVEIRIVYKVEEGEGGGEGITWIRPGEGGEGDDVPPHILTSSSTPTAARSWVPCVDSLFERNTWDLEFVIPRAIYSSDDTSQHQQNEQQHHHHQQQQQSEFHDPNYSSNDSEHSILVVSSGEFIERIRHPKEKGKSVFYFTQPTPVSAQHLAWAVGPFIGVELGQRGRMLGSNTNSNKGIGGGGEHEGHEEEEADTLPALHAFCLPGREGELLNSVSFLRKCMSFYATEFGSYPFSSYKVLFLPTASSVNPVTHSATLSIFSSDYLHPKSIIDQAYETRSIVSHALAVQWSGISIVQKSWSDTWLISGLALYLSGLWTKHSLGNNEYRFRLKKDIQRCVSWDVKMPPLCTPWSPKAPTGDVLAFMNLKAPLVLYALDRHLRRTGTSLGLSRVIPKVFLSAISGELGNNGNNQLSTHGFLKICRKVGASGGSASVDLRGFSEMWIYGNGCPTFRISPNFNRKKMAVEMSVTTDCQAWRYYHSGDVPWEEKCHLKPVQKFEGHMTVRVHEADGTPYEHVIDIRGEGFKKHDVPFNTKYKRVRSVRNGTGAAAAGGGIGGVSANAPRRRQNRMPVGGGGGGGDDPEEMDFEIDDETIAAYGFGLPMWEDRTISGLKNRQQEWRVTDWTEEEEDAMNQSNWEWIRVDIDMEWIAIIVLEQPDYMWVEQLQRERDVVAQLDAIHALSSMPSPVVSSSLCRTALVSNYFFRVRIEAIYALPSCAGVNNKSIGLFHLLKLFQTWFCFNAGGPDNADPLLPTTRLIPKPNDFSDFVQYFIKKALITTISNVRDQHGQSLPLVLQLLTDSLAYNDNTNNEYSDSFYISHIINALSNAFIAVTPKERSEFGHQDEDNVDAVVENIMRVAVDEVSRYMNMDRLVPCYHNAITVAGIESRTKMMMAGLIPVDYKGFLAYTREGNYPPVRIAAFDGILLLRGLGERFIARYLFAVLGNDASLVVRRRLAQSMVECIPILVAFDDLASHSQEESGFVEEDASKMRKKKTEALDMDKVIKQLRKEVGKSVTFRESLMSVMLDPDTDVEVRWCLLKVSEVLFKPADEPLPKLKFRMPLQPVPEPSPPMKHIEPLAPTRPTIKLNFSGSSSKPVPAEDTMSPVSSALPPISIRVPVSNAPDAEAGIEQPGASDATVKKPVAPKPKQAPKPLKAQGSGMPFDDVKACQSIMKKMLQSKKSELFRKPVDPIKDHAQNYFEIIPHPMDLGTMSAKLEEGQYPNKDAFHRDFQLVISNSKTYNAANDQIIKLTSAVESLFEKQWERTTKTVDTMRSRTEASAVEASTSVPPPQPSSIPMELDVSHPPPRREEPKKPVTLVTPAPLPPPEPEQPEAGPSKPRATPLTVKLKTSHAKPVLETSPSLTPMSASEASVPPAPPTTTQTPKEKGLKAPRKPKKVADDGVDDPDAKKKGRPKKEKEKDNGKGKGKEKEVLFEPSTPVPGSAHQVNGNSAIKSAAIDHPPPMEAVSLSLESPRPPPPPAPPDKTSLPSPPSSTAAAPKPRPPKISKPSKPSPTPRTSATPSSKASSKSVSTPTPALTLAPEPSRTHTQNGGRVFKSMRNLMPAEIAHDRPNIKKAKGIVKKMIDMPEGLFFRQPVDPNAEYGPSYYAEIKNPTDLSKIMGKVERGQYSTNGEIEDEFELLIFNCKLYNPPNTDPDRHIEILKAAWAKEWEKANKMPYQEKRSLLGMLTKLRSYGSAFPFLEPVDPIALQIPNYFDIIPKKDARDLKTIRAKLESDQYHNIDAFAADVALMLKNCFTFNAADTPVWHSGKEFEKSFEQALAPLRKQFAAESSGGSPAPPRGTKRAAPGSASKDGPPKKAKHGL